MSLLFTKQSPFQISPLLRLSLLVSTIELLRLTFQNESEGSSLYSEMSCLVTWRRRRITTTFFRSFWCRWWGGGVERHVGWSKGVKNLSPLNTHSHVFTAVTKVKPWKVIGRSLLRSLDRHVAPVFVNKGCRHLWRHNCLLILRPWGEYSDRLTRPFRGFSRSSSSDVWHAGQECQTPACSGLGHCYPMGPKVWGVRNSRIKG